MVNSDWTKNKIKIFLDFIFFPRIYQYENFYFYAHKCKIIQQKYQAYCSFLICTSQEVLWVTNLLMDASKDPLY